MNIASIKITCCKECKFLGVSWVREVCSHPVNTDKHGLPLKSLPLEAYNNVPDWCPILDKFYSFTITESLN